jgi:hypothetical protein
MDGCEVLARGKADDSMKTFPAVLPPTSDAEVDIVKSYRLPANRYPIKPAQWGSFEGRVRSVNDFWLAKSSLPLQRTSR